MRTPAPLLDYSGGHKVRVVTMTRRIAVAFIVLGAPGCQQERETPSVQQTEVRDSAGIRIIENPRPAEGSRLGWEPFFCRAARTIRGMARDRLRRVRAEPSSPSTN